MQMQQQPENQNLMLAIILSVGVLLLWQVFYAGPKLKEEQERQRRIKESEVTSQTTTAGQPGTPAAGAVGGGTPAAPGSSVPTGAAPVVAISREAAVKATPRVAIETPTLGGSIGLKGGRIDDVVMLKYRETVDPKSPPVTLFSPAEAPNPYFADYGWVAASGSAVKVPDKDTVWQVEGQPKLSPATPVTLVHDNGQGVVFRRTIKVDDSYLFTIVDEVENKSAQEVRLHPYGRVFREGTPKIEGFIIQHEGLIGVLGASGLKEITYADVQKDGGSQSFDKLSGGWLGFTDKYWAAALIPDQQQPYGAALKLAQKKALNTREAFQAEFLRDAVIVAPAAKGSVETRLYAGAKQVRLIEQYQQTYGIKQFELLFDWGWFYFITKPIYYLIEWLNKLLGNFGLAILATTVIVKALFFWFANKSYESMAKMKKMQPEMERIKERYKDDRQRQQQELMALYSKEKINPLAGCLPILVQIPVFFALYKIIFISIELRHAPFYGWIKDLSAPDPTSFVNLFGLLPWPGYESLFLGHTIGAWPIVMGITMWLQMQLNPQQPDPTQQMIFNWMPPVFTVMLAGFASGLVIYWAWNNILSLAQQYYIMKRNGVDIPLMENIRKTFGPVGSAASGLGKKKE